MIGCIQDYIFPILTKKKKKGFIGFTLYGSTPTANIPTFVGAKIQTKQKHILTVSVSGFPKQLSMD